MSAVRKFKKSFSSHVIETNPKASPYQSPFLRREALRLSPIKQMENEEDVIEDNKDSFEKSIDQNRDESLQLRQKIYEDMRLIINFKENYKPKRFIFAREKDDDSEIEDLKEEEKMDYVQYYEEKYEEYQRNHDNQDNLYTMKKNTYELLTYYSDPYICLDLRKKVLFIKYLITFVALKITKSKIFDYLMLVVILFNCIILAMMDPKSENLTLNSIDDFLVFIYTMEMGLKMLANGLFFNKNAYFREKWNILDFIVIVAAYIPILFSYEVKSFNLSSFRTIRVLKPLRTITSIKSLKVVVGTLFSSIPLLFDTISVLLLFLNIFSIAGLQLFSGVLKQRCFSEDTGLKYNDNFLCGYEKCPEGNLCGKMIANPQWGVLNFDNFFYSFLMVFKCINLQGWSTLLIMLIQTYSIFVTIYFITLIFIGSFFLLSLTLAVIKAKYSDNAAKRNENLYNQILPKNDVDIHELKLLKRLERSHYKRLKQKKDGINYKNNKSNKIIPVNDSNIFCSNEIIDLPHKIASQKAKENNKRQEKPKKFVRSPSKNFPLGELIMKRVIKNNRKMLKRFFQMKKPFDGEDYKKTKFIVQKINSDNSSNYKLNFVGMKNICIDSSKNGYMKESAPGLRNNLLNSIRSLKTFNPEMFLEEIEKEIPKEIENNPEIQLSNIKRKALPMQENAIGDEIQLKKIKKKALNIQENTTEDDLPFLKSDHESSIVQKEISEINEDPENVNFFNDPLFKHYYQESGIVIPFTATFKNPNRNHRNLKLAMENIDLNKEKTVFQPEFILKSPVALEARQSALDKFLRTPNLKEIEIPNKNLKKSNFGIKLSVVSPDKTSHLDFSPEKRSTLANISNMILQKKRTNLRDYKIMVDFGKIFNSTSEKDVLERKFLKLEKKKIEQVIYFWKKTKFAMVYHQIKKDKSKDQENLVRKEKNINIPVKKSKKWRMSIKYNKVFPLTQRTAEFVSNSKEISALMKSSLMSLKSPKSKSFKSRRKYTNYNHNNLDNNEFVLNYENAKKKFKEKIIADEKPILLENQKIYMNILRRDINERKKCFQHWSGDEVLELDHEHKFFKFNVIRKALSSKNQDKVIWLNGFYGQLSLMHKSLKLFVFSKSLEKFLILVVIFNTIILSSESLFTDPSILNIFQVLNTFFAIVFLIEMVVKIMALSLKGYFSDISNKFDSLVAIIAIIEIILDANDVSQKTVEILRIFRIIRVIRLLRSLKFMKMIIEVLSKTLTSFLYIALLLILFLFIYALLGMKLFGDEFDFPNKVYRQNFDSYQEAFLSVFQILSRSYWFYFLYLMFRSAINNFICSIYLISWIFVGNFVFLNLFLAIILDGFHQAQLEEEVEPELPDENQIEEIKDENLNKGLLNAIESKRIMRFKSMQSYDPLKEKNNTELFKEVYCGSSFYFFSKSNKFRVLLYKIIKSSRFEQFILILIVLNTVKMIVDTYIDTSEVFDQLFTFSFLFETIIKSIVLGFCLDKGSYLRDAWNVLDFIIVVSSLIDIFTTNFSLSGIMVFRLLRTLRPLRFISHNVNMKIVVNSLLDSVTSIINVIIVILIIWLMFAILGVSLLGGRMGYCNIKDFYGISKQKCLEMGMEWKIYDTNFDNIYYALNSLLIIGSLEGWPDIMYYCRDSNTDDIGPIKDNYSFISYYFIAFLLIGAFFLINLFVGVMFFHFNLAQKNEKSKKNLFLTEEQAKWLDIQKMIVNARPDFKVNRRPNTAFQKFLFTVITSKPFDYFIMAIIMINFLILSMYFDGSSLAYKETLEIFHMIIILIFLSELFLKIITYGPIGYLYGQWNIFDFAVNFCSFLDLLTILSPNPFLRVFGFQIRQTLRLMRVTFILKLVKKIKGLNNLIETLLFSLPSLVNVGALLILIYLMYSILGVYLFKNISHGVAINEYNNFHNFHLAMMIIFKCSTADEWFLIMFDLSRRNPGCEETDTCGTYASFIYFISFFLICIYIILNLFILIIIQQFEEYHLRVNNPIQTFRENLETFKKIWSEFSLASEGLNISHRNLIEFYMKLPEPLGFGSGVPKTLIAKEIMNMNLSGDADGNIYFNELLFASMRRAFGAEVLNNAKFEIQILLKREEYGIRKKIERYKKKDIRKFSFISSKASSKINSRNSSFFSSFLDKPMPEEYGFRKNIINPIMEFFFVGMAFKSWKKFSILKAENQLNSNDSLILAQEDSEEEDEEELSKSSLISDEEDEESENEESNKIDQPPRIPFFKSNYIKQRRAKSILVRGEEKERQVEEKNFLFNLKRRVSNLFMVKPIQIHE